LFKVSHKIKKKIGRHSTDVKKIGEEEEVIIGFFMMKKLTLNRCQNDILFLYCNY